jgi:glycosyltransferase involved in cell wall biosynthesis
MKVIHAINNFGGGGSEKVAIELAINHASRGHQCRVVSILRSDSTDEIVNDHKSRLAAAGVAFHELGTASRRFSILLAPPFLAALSGRWKPDIVHSHTDVPDLTVSLACRIRKFRVARTIHSTSLWPTHFSMGKVAESGINDDLVISVSADAEEAYEKLRQGYGLSVSRNRLRIPNGVAVAPPMMGMDRSFLATEFGADPHKVQFCFAGRFDPQKRVRHSLRCSFRTFRRGPKETRGSGIRIGRIGEQLSSARRERDAAGFFPSAVSQDFSNISGIRRRAYSLSV